MKKLLVYRIGLLGDTIIALPALKAIRNNYPDARITLLYNKFSGGVHPPEILLHTDLIDEYACYCRENGALESVKLWGKIRNVGYDAIIYLAPTRRAPRQVLRDKLFFRSTGIQELIGFDSPRADCRFISEAPHESVALLRMLEASGLKVDREITFANLLKPSETDADLCERRLTACGIEGEARHKMVAVGIGSNMPAKKWPDESFLALGRGIIDTLGLIPVTIGGNEDKGPGDRMVQAWGAGANLAGALSVIQSYYVLSKCRFYVGNDSGAMHLAVSAGLKCVAIFSARDSEKRWYPYGDEHIVLRKDVLCAGCMLWQCDKKPPTCIEQISVKTTLAACRALAVSTAQPSKECPNKP